MCECLRGLLTSCLQCSRKLPNTREKQKPLQQRYSGSPDVSQIVQDRSKKEIQVLGTPLQAGPFKATGPRVGACARKDPEVRTKVLEPDYLGSESYVTSEFNLWWRQAPLPPRTPATGSPKEPSGLLTFRSSSRSRAELLVSPGPLEGMAGSWAVGGSLGFEGSGGAAGLQRQSYCGLREQELKLTHRS